MRVTSARPKPMPPARAGRATWLLALAWLLFCAAMVAVVLFLTPRMGAAYAVAGVPTVASTDSAQAIPMAATALYPNESVAVTVKH